MIGVDMIRYSFCFHGLWDVEDRTRRSPPPRPEQNLPARTGRRHTGEP